MPMNAKIKLPISDGYQRLHFRMIPSRIHRLTLTHFRNYRAASLQTGGTMLSLLTSKAPMAPIAPRPPTLTF